MPDHRNDGHAGWWPSHWGAAGFLLFPFWWLYLLLLPPVLYLSRFLTWITPGRRWRSPIDEHLVLGGAIFPWDPGALKREGVGAVINLCAEFHDPVERLKSLGIDHLDLPTLDRAPPSPEALKRGVARLREKVSQGVRTYVHCASGAGRSATLLARYFVEEGMSPEEALAFLKTRRPQVSLHRAQREALGSP